MDVQNPPGPLGAKSEEAEKLETNMENFTG